MLRGIGVDYAQGHFIGEPVPIESVLEEFADTASAAAS